MTEDDPILRALRALPPRAPTSRASRRARSHALAELRALPSLELAKRAWGGFVGPALVAGFAAAYLAWAFHVAASVYS